MFKKLMAKASKSMWSAAAMIIVVLVAGPEVVLSMELMAMVELLGASTFVMAYLAGFRLWFDSGLKALSKFESHSWFFVPTLDALKQMPSMILHSVPERVVTIAFLSVVTGVMVSRYLVILA